MQQLNNQQVKYESFTGDKTIVEETDDDILRLKNVVGSYDQSNIESLDFNVADNVPQRATELSNSRVQFNSFLFSVYVMCFVLGILIVLVMFVLTLAVENITCFKVAVTLYVAKKSSILSFVTYASINLVMILFAVFMMIKYGTDSELCGIPDVMAYLNGVDVPGALLVRTFISKLFGVIGTVSSGLPLGKDGPFLHIGAMIAQFLSQGGSKRFRLNFNWLKLFKNDRTRADLVACGSAAGLAAAFRSPVGGVMFLIETIASSWYRQLLWKAFFTTAVVSLTYRFISEVCQKDQCGYFHSLSVIFQIGQQGQQLIKGQEIVPVAFLGLVGGILSVLFIQINTRIHRWRRRVIFKRNRGRVIEAIIISLIISAITFGLSKSKPCMKCSEEALVNKECPSNGTRSAQKYLNFFCYTDLNSLPPDTPPTYNDLASLLLTYQNDAIRNLFSPRTSQEYTISSLLMVFLYSFTLSVYCYGMSVAGGLFAPGILIGASYGRLIGSFFKTYHGFAYIDESTYALLGAASFLGGLMRSPISICVILLEVTNNLGLIGQLTLVLLIAVFVADGFGVESIYVTHLQLRNIPILDKLRGYDPKEVNALDISSKNVVSFKKVESVSRLVEVLKNYNHQSFPVYDTLSIENPNPDHMDYFQLQEPKSLNGSASSEILQSIPKQRQVFVGNIMRYHIIVLLKGQRVFQLDNTLNEQSLRIAQKYDIREFDKPVSCLAPKIDEVGLDAKALELFVNLGPYVNLSYQVVPSSASAENAFTQFKTLSLRHLFVVPQPQEVVGIITRKDIVPSVLETCLHQDTDQNQAFYMELKNKNSTSSISSLVSQFLRQVPGRRKSNNQHNGKIQITNRRAANIQKEEQNRNQVNQDITLQSRDQENASLLRHNMHSKDMKSMQ